MRTETKSQANNSHYTMNPKFLSYILILLTFAARAADLPISAYNTTNKLGGADDFIVNSYTAGAGSGYKTRRASLSNIVESARALDSSVFEAGIAKLKERVNDHTGPLNILAIGDSMSDSGNSISTEFIRLAQNRWGFAGIGYHNYDANNIHVPSGGVTYNATWTPGGSANIPPGDSLEFQRTGYSKGHYSDQIKLYYQPVPDGGNFKIQISTNGAAFADLATISGAGGFGYRSDFTAGANGWSAILGLSSVTGNVDGISDGTTTKNDVLRLTTDTSSTSHYTSRAASYATGVRTKISLSYYIPTGQTVAKIRVGTSLNTAGFYVDGTTVGTWSTIDTEIPSSGAALFISAHSGVTGVAGEMVYVKDMVVTQYAAPSVATYNLSANYHRVKVVSTTGTNVVMGPQFSLSTSGGAIGHHIAQGGIDFANWVTNIAYTNFWGNTLAAIQPDLILWHAKDAAIDANAMNAWHAMVTNNAPNASIIYFGAYGTGDGSANYLPQNAALRAHAVQKGNAYWDLVNRIPDATWLYANNWMNDISHGNANMAQWVAPILWRDAGLGGLIRSHPLKHGKDSPPLLEFHDQAFNGEMYLSEANGGELWQRKSGAWAEMATKDYLETPHNTFYMQETWYGGNITSGTIGNLGWDLAYGTAVKSGQTRTWGAQYTITPSTTTDWAYLNLYPPTYGNNGLVGLYDLSPTDYALSDTRFAFGVHTNSAVAVGFMLDSVGASSAALGDGLWVITDMRGMQQAYVYFQDGAFNTSLNFSSFPANVSTGGIGNIFGSENRILFAKDNYRNITVTYNSVSMTLTNLLTSSWYTPAVAVKSPSSVPTAVRYFDYNDKKKRTESVLDLKNWK